MGNLFSGSEVVELGIQIEKNGYEFYTALSVAVKEKKAQELFKFLAGEEQKHIAVFQKLLERVERYTPAEAYPGEYFAYMNALASEHIFTRKDQGRAAAEAAKSDKEAIEMGIGFEKDSIIFYEGMKRLVPTADQNLVENLIQQEQGHLRQLTELKKYLGKAVAGHQVTLPAGRQASHHVTKSL